MEHQQSAQEPQEASICRTPGICRIPHREPNSSEKKKKLSKKERFWKHQGTHARANRRWAQQTTFTVKRNLFPRLDLEDTTSEEEECEVDAASESDLSGYSFDWCTESDCEADDDATYFASEADDEEPYRSPVRSGFVYVSEETQDCFDFQLRETTPVADDENVHGVKIAEQEPMEVHYPYADDCSGAEVPVAYEVEVVACE